MAERGHAKEEAGAKPPSSLELLWGNRERPARGPKPKLSVDKIARAAIAVADAEGLDALSMQRVAHELGYTTMSLYRYVPGKEQLIDVMMDLALGPPPELDEARQDWRAAAEAWATALWTGLHRHPWAVRVQVKSPPMGPNGTAWFEAGLRAFSGIGLDDGEMIAMVMFISSAVRDLARLSIDLGEAVRRDGGAALVGEGYARAIAAHMETGRFPVLAGMLAAGTFTSTGDLIADVRPDFEFGLHRLLDGVQAYVRKRG